MTDLIGFIERAGGYGGYVMYDIKPECIVSEAPSHLEMSENIQSCEASIAASAAVLESMADCLMEVTSGREIPQEHPTSPETPKGLLRVATDGERCNGRLCWVPGAR